MATVPQLIISSSRKNQNPTQPTITRRTEARVAAIWYRMVCRMHYVDNWKLIKSWNKYGAVVLGGNGTGAE